MLDLPDRIREFLLTLLRVVKVELVIDDDRSQLKHYLGFRVQHSKARGPMKGARPTGRQTGKELWTLWIIPTDGSPPIETELQHELANAGAPRLNIHPDGKRVVYVAGGYFQQFWALRDLTFDEPGQTTE